MKRCFTACILPAQVLECVLLLPVSCKSVSQPAGLDLEKERKITATLRFGATRTSLSLFAPIIAEQHQHIITRPAMDTPQTAPDGASSSQSQQAVGPPNAVMAMAGHAKMVAMNVLKEVSSQQQQSCPRASSVLLVDEESKTH